MVWVIEWDTSTYGHLKGVKRVLYSGSSRYQRIEVVETHDFGKLLLLDGKSQSSEVDEFVYHEALVHPAMILHGEPRRILILGGGEGATLREALKHRSVEKAVMVDIDEEVVRVSRELLPFLSAGAFDDGRAELIIGDALDYVNSATEKFDVIIADLSDPLEAGPAYKLYTLEFYKQLGGLLAEGGIFVTQATSPSNTGRAHAIIYNTARHAFRYATYYHVFMHAFSGLWGFVMGSNDVDVRNKEIDVDAELRRRGISTRFYDSVAHRHMFSVPKHMREAIEAEAEISTLSKPAFIY